MYDEVIRRIDRIDHLRRKMEEEVLMPPDGILDMELVHRHCDEVGDHCRWLRLNIPNFDEHMTPYGTVPGEVY